MIGAASTERGTRMKVITRRSPFSGTLGCCEWYIPEEFVSAKAKELSPKQKVVTGEDYG
jgi:hypothetical protein